MASKMSSYGLFAEKSADRYFRTRYETPTRHPTRFLHRYCQNSWRPSSMTPHTYQSPGPGWFQIYTCLYWAATTSFALGLSRFALVTP